MLRNHCRCRRCKARRKREVVRYGFLKAPQADRPDHPQVPSPLATWEAAVITAVAIVATLTWIVLVIRGHWRPR